MKARGKKTKDMEKEFITTKTEKCTGACTAQAREKGMGHSTTKMGIGMKESGKMGILMGLGYTTTVLGRCTWVTTKTTREMVKVATSIKTALFMMEIGKTEIKKGLDVTFMATEFTWENVTSVSDMVRAFTSLKMGLVMKATGLKANEKGGVSINTPMGASTQDSTKVAFEKEWGCTSTSTKRYIKATGKRTRKMGMEPR